MKKIIIFILILSTVMLSADIYSMGNPKEDNAEKECSNTQVDYDGLSKLDPLFYGMTVPPFAANNSMVLWFISGVYYMLKVNPNFGNGFNNMPPTNIWFAGCTATYILTEVLLFNKITNSDRYKYDKKARDSFIKAFRISTVVTSFFLIVIAAFYAHYIGDGG